VNGDGPTTTRANALAIIAGARIRRGAVVEITYLFTPEQYRHLGVAGALATHVFDWARTKGYSIRPSASYIRDDFVPNNAAGLGFTFRPLTGRTRDEQARALPPCARSHVHEPAGSCGMPRAGLCEPTPNFDAKHPTPGLDRALAQTGTISRQ
jgi:predicted GNAT family acetyltransferase